MPIIKSERSKHIIGIETPIYLFLKLIIENKATAVIGVKLGGWGTNRESTATTMIARTKYILLIFIFQCNYKGLFFLTHFLYLH